METIKYYTKEEIREALKKRLGNDFCSKIAGPAEKSKSWVSRHISGTLRTKEGRKLIACSMGKVDGKRVKMSQIYPE